MKYTLFTLAMVISVAGFSQPTISFTFDDGSTSDRGAYKFEQWNEMILQHLEQAEVSAIFFVRGSGMNSDKGKYLLDSWDQAGHGIANHTYSHPNFNSNDFSAQDFEIELLKTDSIIKNYDNYLKLFRFPYLKEGNTADKVDSIRQLLSNLDYRNGYVTIDASDWYIDSRLRKRLNENPNADLEPFKRFYLEHLLGRAQFYEDLSYQLNQRHINHTLLLHHNLAAALFLDDLIEMFKTKGWRVISAPEAFQDPVFLKVPKHAGESLIWALAKDSGKYDSLLRYPAEDSRYEKERMDEKGL